MPGIEPKTIVEVSFIKSVLEIAIRVFAAIIFLSRGLYTLYRMQAEKLRKAYVLFACVLIDIGIACAFLLLPTNFSLILVVLIVLVQILYRKSAA